MAFGVSKKVITILGVVFAGIAVILVIVGITLNNRAREAFLKNQADNLSSPETAVKRQVKRVLLKRETEEDTEYIEILANGQVNLYDADFNLVKSGLQGFTTINNLYDKINRNLDNLDQLNFGGSDKYTLTVETNHGTTTVIIDNNGDGEVDEDLEDIIDDIEDIEDDIENPPPTATPQPTSTPGPTPTGFVPTPSATPIISPTPTPTPGPGTPTPLPGYMTAPPFSCDDYDNLGKPVIISNTTCGAD